MLSSVAGSLNTKSWDPHCSPSDRMRLSLLASNACKPFQQSQLRVRGSGGLFRVVSSGLGAQAAAVTLEEQSMPQDSKLRTLEGLEVTSSFIDELPGDKEEANKLRQVHDAVWSRVAPTSSGGEPYFVAGSTELAHDLGLDPGEFERHEFAAIFAGNAQLPGTARRSWAQCYGGHQFGQWAGQLGDGRAISLGEVTGPSGQRYELQLKGAGRTPYSRMADGRAVMRSSVREFIGSEALYHLGIPTTRALSLVGTGAEVMRDMFYNGNVKLEPGAVVCRVSPSFVRFGTFQLPASRGSLQTGLVRMIADYVIKHHYSHLQDREDKYKAWLTEVARRTGKLVAKWQCVAFVHGVLNSDNMSILGETIDYGPYGFLEVFDPNYTPNTTDEGGRRYAFSQQPEIGQWNLAQLANALLIGGLMTQEEATDAVGEYSVALKAHYEEGMAAKLGLPTYNRDIAVGLLTNMYQDDADFTNTFRALSDISVDDPEDSMPTSLSKEKSLLQAIPGDLSDERLSSWKTWLNRYRSMLKDGLEEPKRKELQNSVNPCYIPRNHLLQGVIAEAEKGNYKAVQDYLELLKQPFTEQPGMEKWRKTSGGQIRRGIEMLSCSS